MTAEQLATEKKRLWWHSRRGMLELDLLLLPFLEDAYSDLSEHNKAKYRKLLDCEDPDLFKWFMQTGRSDDQDLADIVDIILKRVQPS
jgi:antitoxin CptB